MRAPSWKQSLSLLSLGLFLTFGGAIGCGGSSTETDSSGETTEETTGSDVLDSAGEALDGEPDCPEGWDPEEAEELGLCF